MLHRHLRGFPEIRVSWARALAGLSAGAAIPPRGRSAADKIDDYAHSADAGTRRHSKPTSVNWLL